ncbi:MAG: hypothetical protein Q7U04_04875 [Bacteriovorax sp.]|nr:hypothetical protein [Bacteriovorax sp.]
MKLTILILISLFSFQSFASREESSDSDPRVIRTEEDAQAENKVSCLNFQSTHEMIYDSRDVYYETESCYIREHDRRILSSAFLNQLRKYTNQDSIGYETRLSTFASGTELQASEYNRILLNTVKALSATEGCEAKIVKKYFGEKIKRNKPNGPTLYDIIPDLEDSVRCY